MTLHCDARLYPHSFWAGYGDAFGVRDKTPCLLLIIRGAARQTVGTRRFWDTFTCIIHNVASSDLRSRENL